MYAEDSAWDDVIPLPQDDGNHPLAQISYSNEYAEAMAYLRALMAKEEMSERTLKLTEHIISLNPAHYTVWSDRPSHRMRLYRAKTLFRLGSDLKKELEFLNMMAFKHEKNYQIWHHRQLIVDKLGEYAGEQDFIKEMFERESKNYHVWSYRQWLVKRFNLWDNGEIEYLNSLLEDDVRNNSAWNHRFFVVFGRGSVVPNDIIEQEISFAEEAIFLAPQNPSPWNYLRGILAQSNLPLSRIKKLCLHYAPPDNSDRVKSSHALDFLAEINAKEGDGKGSLMALDLLTTKFDPVRAPYWNFRKVSVSALSV